MFSDYLFHDWTLNAKKMSFPSLLINSNNIFNGDSGNMFVIKLENNLTVTHYEDYYES